MHASNNLVLEINRAWQELGVMSCLLLLMFRHGFPNQLLSRYQHTIIIEINKLAGKKVDPGEGNSQVDIA